MSEPVLQVHAILLDDNRVESNNFATLLTDESLKVDAIEPEPSIDETLARLENILDGEGARIVLIDYRLDDRSDGVRFRGGSVAGGLKDRHPEIPVVLLTTDEKLNHWVSKRPGMEEFFDWRLLKGLLNDPISRGEARAVIVDIALGWSQLHAVPAESTSDPWDWLAGILATERSQLEPFEALDFQELRPDAPSEVAEWLIRGPLQWPGPLYKQDDTRVLCGLAESSFCLAPVQEWLMDDRYQGPFQAFGPFWWAARVRQAFATLAGGERPLRSQQRAAVLGEHLGIELEPEPCNWCGRGLTTRACSICRRATDAAHSLRRLTDPPPAWADVPVVCFRCVVEGNAEDVRFSPGDEEIVQGLKSGSIVPPDAGYASGTE